MKTFGKSLALAGLLVAGGLGVGTKPAEAQVGIGIATPGFSLGIGPQVGYGYYGGYYPPPVVVPRPIVVAPPIYGPRPYYGGAYYGGFRGGYPGGYYGRPGYGHYRR
jgi:hypothetical protein